MKSPGGRGWGLGAQPGAHEAAAADPQGTMDRGFLIQGAPPPPPPPQGEEMTVRLPHPDRDMEEFVILARDFGRSLSQHLASGDTVVVRRDMGSCGRVRPGSPSQHLWLQVLKHGAGSLRPCPGCRPVRRQPDALATPGPASLPPSRLTVAQGFWREAVEEEEDAQGALAGARDPHRDHIEPRGQYWKGTVVDVDDHRPYMHNHPSPLEPFHLRDTVLYNSVRVTWEGERPGNAGTKCRGRGGRWGGGGGTWRQGRCRVPASHLKPLRAGSPPSPLPPAGHRGASPVAGILTDGQGGSGVNFEEAGLEEGEANTTRSCFWELDTWEDFVGERRLRDRQALVVSVPVPAPCPGVPGDGLGFQAGAPSPATQPSLAGRARALGALPALWHVRAVSALLPSPHQHALARSTGGCGEAQGTQGPPSRVSRQQSRQRRADGAAGPGRAVRVGPGDARVLQSSGAPGWVHRAGFLGSGCI